MSAALSPRHRLARAGQHGDERRVPRPPRGRRVPPPHRPRDRRHVPQQAPHRPRRRRVGASRSTARGARATASTSTSTRRSSSGSRTAAGRRSRRCRSTPPSMPSGPEPLRLARRSSRLCAAQQEEMRGRYGASATSARRARRRCSSRPTASSSSSRDEARARSACGGICRFDETRAELKRMYVVPAARGRGLGQRCSTRSRRRRGVSATRDRARDGRTPAGVARPLRVRGYEQSRATALVCRARLEPLLRRRTSS